MVRPNLGMINSFCFPPFFVFFSNIVTEIHSSHLKGTALSQLISLSPSIRPSCFSFSLLPCIHLVPGCPPPPCFPLRSRPSLWYSQSHLQSDIFNGLITPSSHSLIEHVTPTPHLLGPRHSLLTSTHFKAPASLLVPSFHLSPLLFRFHLLL